MERAAVEATLDALPAGVVRAKGIVRLTEDPGTRVVVQRVGARHSFTADGPWRGGPSRLVTIGVTAALPPGWAFELAAP